jgi:hypothetical protein
MGMERPYSGVRFSDSTFGFAVQAKEGSGCRTVYAGFKPSTEENLLVGSRPHGRHIAFRTTMVAVYRCSPSGFNTCRYVDSQFHFGRRSFRVRMEVLASEGLTNRWSQPLAGILKG